MLVLPLRVDSVNTLLLEADVDRNSSGRGLATAAFGQELTHMLTFRLKALDFGFDRICHRAESAQGEVCCRCLRDFRIQDEEKFNVH